MTVYEKNTQLSNDQRIAYVNLQQEHKIENQKLEH